MIRRNENMLCNFFTFIMTKSSLQSNILQKEPAMRKVQNSRKLKMLNNYLPKKIVVSRDFAKCTTVLLCLLGGCATKLIHYKNPELVQYLLHPHKDD